MASMVRSRGEVAYVLATAWPVALATLILLLVEDPQFYGRLFAESYACARTLRPAGGVMILLGPISHGLPILHAPYVNRWVVVLMTALCALLINAPVLRSGPLAWVLSICGLLVWFSIGVVAAIIGT